MHRDESNTPKLMGIKIETNGNTYELPDPTEMTYNLSDISQSDAGRDEQGVMHPMKLVDEHGNLVLKRHYQLGWSGATPDEVYTIMQACSQTETFMLTIIDPMSPPRDEDGKKISQLVTFEAYVGDRSAPFQQWHDGTDGHLYQKVSYTLIEV